MGRQSAPQKTVAWERRLACFGESETAHYCRNAGRAG